MSYKTAYIDIPTLNKNTQRVGKTKKMAKKETTPTAKTRRSYNKTRAEHYKDILIAVLITGIIAFVAGLQFANSNNEAIQAAVEAVTPVAEATELK